MPACPDPQILHDYADGTLHESNAAALEGHLETCRRCAEALARLPVGQEMIERIRDLHESRSKIELVIPAGLLLRHTRRCATSGQARAGTMRS